MAQANTQSPLIEMHERFGQSPWLDSIDRDLLKSGKLQDLVARHGLRGMTSNPSIFEKAMAHADAYDDQIRSLLAQGDWEVKALYEELAIADIQAAADILRPVYDRSAGQDGFVSFEVSPALARHTSRTIDEAQRLWHRLDRPNAMIKVPGTNEGIPAIRALIAQGINVNVTLLFSRTVYRQAIQAYLEGLEARVAKKKPVDRIASVASFFVSRIDSAIDRKLAALNSPEASALSGTIAIANAKLAYADYLELVASERWKALARAGAHPQRLLWASTSTKNPAFSDVLYVEALMGRDTVNTLPPATMEAFEKHGRAGENLDQDLPSASRALESLGKYGISLDAVTDQLTIEAIRLFMEPFDSLLGTLERKKRRMAHEGINPLSLRLPALEMMQMGETLQDWREQGKIRRLWEGDASLWTGKDESRWMGWLNAINVGQSSLGELERFRAEVLASGIQDVVLLGMGGSSLAPEVFDKTFDASREFPDFHVLDSTDPEQIAELEKTIDPGRALFIVSSKSGTTLEPNIFFDYFYDKVAKKVGAAQAGRHFVAITDPSSQLEKIAVEKHFLRVFHGEPAIGGRYSALSAFGLVPATLIGVDVARFLKRAKIMANACSANVPAEENPGVILGATLGALGKAGRDKITLVCSPAIEDLASWLEQLLAESTGKLGKGLIPVADEAVGTPDSYGEDRLFVYIKTPGDRVADLDHQIEALENFGHPVIRVEVEGDYSLGQEFFRWEMATAVAGSILGINPFDQPDVEASKTATRKLTSELEQTGRLPEERAIFEADRLRLFADERNKKELYSSLGSEPPSLVGLLRAHFDRLHPNDYAAVLAYVDMSLAGEDFLQTMRESLRSTYRVATCLGFGPRFLHSTGQAYKGGSNHGVFLQITADHGHDLAIPGHAYHFGQVQAAQARGDFEVLVARGRRCLRVHLPSDTGDSLRKLEEVVLEAIGKGRGRGRAAA